MNHVPNLLGLSNHGRTKVAIDKMLGTQHRQKDFAEVNERETHQNGLNFRCIWDR